jgi:hypothetical protein
MVTKFLPGSFTKQFGWRKDPERLHRSVRNGFRNEAKPVTREAWRKHCGLRDNNIDLIPIDFFLYSKKESANDYLLVDTFVELALDRPYDSQFAKLAVFDFHLANSGNWRGSEWPDGSVAGWANVLVRDLAWKGGAWTNSVFEKQRLLEFFEEHVEGVHDTRRKMRNNYRFMLEHAGLLIDGKIQPTNVATLYAISAPQLFWDRQIFDGKLRSSSPQSEYEDLFLKHEVYKLLNCGRDQGQALAKSAFRDYSKTRLKERFKQIDAFLKAAA